VDGSINSGDEGTGSIDGDNDNHGLMESKYSKMISNRAGGDGG